MGMDQGMQRRRALTIRAAVRAVVGSGDTARGFAEIQAALTEAGLDMSEPSVRAVLSKMHLDGELSRPGRGLYGHPTRFRKRFPAGIDVVRPDDTRVLLAVVTDHRPTVRRVAAATGISVGSTYERLRHLKTLGLVDWQPGRRGTLHAPYRPVQVF